MRLVLFAVAALAAQGCARGPSPPAGPASAPRLAMQTSGTTALLQAVSPVSDRVVWASGHAGTWAITTDGGTTWRASRVPDADTLQFRDVEAFDSLTAYLLAAGPGDMSRIYRTDDGGRTWSLQFRNAEPAAFYDCLTFWDRDHGAAVSDAVRGRMVILTTSNGGRTWEQVPDEAIPEALPGEGAFAASGTCLVRAGSRHAWIGTGSESGARVYRTTDRGRTWTVATTPIVHGPASGIASLAFRDGRDGFATGGRLGAPDERADNVALTRDGGITWTLAVGPPFTGAVYGSALVPGLPRALLVAGPRGLAVSYDEAASWRLLESGSWWAVGCASRRACWAVGPRGRIARIALP